MERRNVHNFTKTFALQPFLYNILSVYPRLFNIICNPLKYWFPTDPDLTFFTFTNDFCLWPLIFVQELKDIWQYLQGCLDKGT